MARSKQTIPHYYLSTTVDLRRAMGWMQSVNAGRPVTQRLVPAALLLKATAQAARDVPEMNGFYEDGSVPAERVGAPRRRGVAPHGRSSSRPPSTTPTRSRSMPSWTGCGTSSPGRAAGG